MVYLITSMFSWRLALRVLVLTPVVIVMSFLVQSCSGSNSKEKATLSRISVEDGVIKDEAGRSILLNGICHINKDPAAYYLHQEDSLLFIKFKALGFNCVRYGIFWDALEPRPGVYNEVYLKEIDKRVRWAEDNGIYLILDMHQDLYARRFSDGAPEWATLDEDMPHVTGAIWSDSYLLSPAVQKSFDNFWANKPAKDGKGVQDRYVNVLKVLAERYRSNSSVAGIDVMNEPFPGSVAKQILPLLLTKYAEIVYEDSGQKLNEDELAALWGNASGRNEALEVLNRNQNFQKLISVIQTISDNFEQGSLSAFYQKVRDSIREVNEDILLGFNHNYFCNMGVESTFKIPYDENGVRDSLVLYTPHAYDLVVDTDDVEKVNDKRLSYILSVIDSSAKKRGVPVVLDEWGAFPLSSDVSYVRPCNVHINLIERYKMGQTYWAYQKGISKQSYFSDCLVRSYPVAVTGTLLSYRNEIDGSFSCSWKPNLSISKPTLIYVSDVSEFKAMELQTNVAPEHIELIEIPNSHSAFLAINSDGKSKVIKFGWTVK
ncbi:endoglycosylceramidase [Zhouia amylolytica]|uniref:Endoglycosylceramidase n=1 Tax=Zhouia amylolytica TaxID=376730 RepID=A0A1I6UY88_9FLAO|nr:cellulase family glycosylhydrolase [Zhouia amylolytica]SFT06415.1 endoglycosylceramidase [Zhouia amylolytica]